MDNFERLRRYMGLPLPYSMSLLVNVLGVVWDWAMKYFSDP